MRKRTCFIENIFDWNLDFNLNEDLDMEKRTITFEVHPSSNEDLFKAIITSTETPSPKKGDEVEQFPKKDVGTQSEKERIIPLEELEKDNDVHHPEEEKLVSQSNVNKIQWKRFIPERTDKKKHIPGMCKRLLWKGTSRENVCNKGKYKYNLCYYHFRKTYPHEKPRKK